MRSHDVHLVCCVVKLDGITTFFVAAGAGFSFVVWLLCGVLGVLILQYFTLFCRVPGAMQHVGFTPGQPIDQMA